MGGSLMPCLGDVRLVAVDGFSGAGKSTFAARLRGEFGSRGLGCAVISTDDFATWDNPVAWWPRLVSGVFEPLAVGEPARYRKLDWTTGSPAPGALVTVEPPEVLILEGVSAGRVSVRPLLSRLYWLDGPDERTRRERVVARDGEATQCHIGRWQAFERGWFAVDRTREYIHLNGLVIKGQIGQNCDDG